MTRAEPGSVRHADGLLIGRPFIDVDWKAQGKRVRAIGNTIAMRPPEETNYEFFVSVLCSTMTEEWHEEQLGRPEAERHVIERWVEMSNAVRAGEVSGVPVTKEGEGLYSAPMIGDLKSLACLAYDVYTLRHHNALPHKLLARLKSDDQFQGARYEIAVAAVFLRAGCEIEWLTATDRKLPEFLAIHPITGREIAVEAKSRHRPGVLGRAGEVPELSEITVDIGHLMGRALEKGTDGRAYVICLDLNVPPGQGGDQAQWISEINRKVLKPYGTEETGEPDPFSAVFITNYSWHWDGQDPAGNPLAFAVAPQRTSVPLEMDEGRLIHEAILQYGNVPERDEGDGAD